MFCPKCGAISSDDARVCASCGRALPEVAPAGPSVQIKTSGAAIAAFVLGILSLFTCGLTALPAVIVGIIALVGISRSAGRRTGHAYAIIGIVLPVFSVFFIALLAGIMMPALARTRQLAFRMTCGTNLAGLGKAMLIYANDYDDELPRPGGRSTTWGPMPAEGWLAPTRAAAFGLAADGSGGTAGISSCFYLLVKYAEVTPKSFVCKSDADTTEFMLSSYPGRVPPGVGLIDLWDFGPADEAYKHCSYSYHVPFNLYALTTSNEPGMPVAADKNPWIPPTSDALMRFQRFMPDRTGPGVSMPGTSEAARQGNAVAHQMDGQNVLFLDTHVEFAKRAFCGVDDDNIYTISTLADRGDLRGMMPTPGPTCVPANRKDSLLVQDPK